MGIMRKLWKLLPQKARLKTKERISYIVNASINTDTSQDIRTLFEYHNLHQMRFQRGPVDIYLTALTILSYYTDEKKYKSLDAEGKRIIEYLKSKEFYRDSLVERFYPLDDYMTNFVNLQSGNKTHYLAIPRVAPDYKPNIQTESGTNYASIEGRKVFLPYDIENSIKYWIYLIEEQLPDSPHCYLEKNGKFNVAEGDIVVDVGAAEGYFCIEHMDKIKHGYVFETEDYWFNVLEKTYRPYKNKITLIKGFVGDSEGNISLDSYFKDKEKPTFIKLDVEGAEGSVLRSMSDLMKNPMSPLRLAICTYHRQEDAGYFEHLLGDLYEIQYSHSYYWHKPEPIPPFLRRGVMRATKKT